MKINENFILKTIAGASVVIPVGEAASEIRGMITLNETAELIWKELDAGSDYDGILAKLKSEYNAEESVLKEDLDAFLNKLKEKNILLDD